MTTPTEANQKTRVVLPGLHEGQREIAGSKARFKVVVCGRRYGKTTLGIWLCARGALSSPGVYWWVGPNYPSIAASAAWTTLKRLITPIEGTVVREADRYVTFPNGSEIWVKSADNPDALRGPKLSGVVLDEFAQIKEEAWTEVLRPSLSDLKGWALFIGTPKGKNWAYRLFQAAASRDGWEAWQKPTVDNPWIEAEEIEAARQEMSEESFAQEYEADFGASQYLVYPEVVPEIHRWKGPLPDFVSYHGGMDFGGDSISSHYSATVIAGRTNSDDLVILKAFKQAGPNIAERQLNWTNEAEEEIRVNRKHSKQKPIGSVTYRADKSQMVGIQFMRRFGMNVYATKGGQDSVQEGIELVHRRLAVRTDPVTGRKKPKMYWLPWLSDVENDLMKYRYAEPSEGREPRKNPLKIDDDLVDAIRYMVEGVDRNIIGDPQKLYERSLPRLS